MQAVAGAQLAIEFGAADFVIVSEAFVRSQQNGTQPMGLARLEDVDCFLNAFVFPYHVSQATRPGGVHVQHVETNISEMAHGVSAMQGDEPMRTVSDAIGIAAMRECPADTGMENHPAQPREIRFDRVYSQVSEVDLEDASRLGE